MASAVKRSFALLLAALTLVTLYTHEAYVFRPADPLWAHFRPFRWWLLPHVICGTLAFLLTPLQFSSTLRRTNLHLHRWLGRIYVVAVIISSLLSVYIVMVFERPDNHAVMGVMGLLWLITTVMAWIAIRRRNVQQHRLWMARSFGLTFTFVATRFIPDVVFHGMTYVGQTALYWILIVASLILPDIVMGGEWLLGHQRLGGLRPAE